MRKLALGAVLALCACGSSTSGPPLDPNFAGTWNGTSQLSLTGIATYPPVSSQYVVTVSGNTATTVVCNAGTVFNPTGSGDSASWSGTVTCPAFDSSGPLTPFTCGSVVATFTSATASLSSIELTVTSLGNAVGCGQTYPATESFSGSK